MLQIVVIDSLRLWSSVKATWETGPLRSGPCSRLASTVLPTSHTASILPLCCARDGQKDEREYQLVVMDSLRPGSSDKATWEIWSLLDTCQHWAAHFSCSIKSAHLLYERQGQRDEPEYQLILELFNRNLPMP